MQWKVDFIQLATTSSVDGPRSSSKSLSKARLTPKKGHVTVWWFATHLIHYSFPNPGETITCEKYAQQINEMHRKLQCLRPALVKRMGPILLYDNTQLLVTQSTLQKLNESRYVSFASSATFTWILADQLPLFQASWQLFGGKMLRQPAGCRKEFQQFPKVCPKHGFLCYRNKQTYFSLAKVCWL